jgi:hypothetical protein
MNAQGSRWPHASGSSHGSLRGGVDRSWWHPQQAHMDESYAAYLRWYLPRTRLYCIRAAHVDDEDQHCHWHLPPTSWSVADWSDTSIILLVHSMYGYFLFLISELIQLSVVDANRTPPPCRRGEFVPTGVDGVWGLYSWERSAHLGQTCTRRYV